MSVEFTNTYQEILLENLMAVIKQNFLFQTQIKIAENSSKENEEVKKKLEELTVLYNTAKSELSQLDVYKNKAESNSSAHEEKSRIQSALNDLMKKNSGLQKELEDKNNELNRIKNEKNNELTKVKNEKDNEITKLKDYINQLEDIAPTTKLKKINPEKVVSKDDTINVLSVFENKNDSTKIENKLQKVLDGSTF
jgi:DNA repair exonuclease SbcCD ATPase subunit